MSTETPRAPRAPKTWPGYGMPTAAQWRDWFLACSPEAQLELAEIVLRDSAIASRCLLDQQVAAKAAELGALIATMGEAARELREGLKR